MVQETLPVEAQELWARVTILLDTLDIPAATQLATDAVAASRFKPGTQFMTAQVVGCSELPVRWCYLDPHLRLAVVNRGVWRQHIMTAAMYRFAERVTTLREPGFAAYDVASWRLLDELDSANAGVNRRFT